MGQKIHPVGYRLGVIYDWESRWYADGKKYQEYLHNDLELRNWIINRWKSAGVSRVEIERIGNGVGKFVFLKRTFQIVNAAFNKFEKPDNNNNFLSSS